MNVISSLAFAVHGPDYKGKLIAMLAGYFDESGGIDTPVLSMGGYISDEANWRRFNREWKRMLIEFGIDTLHMKELSHFRGQFEGWPKSRQEALMSRAIFIIRSRVMFPIGTAIPMQSYFEIKPELRLRLGDPYYLCFRSVILALMNYCRKNSIKERVALVFDTKAKFSSRAIDIYNNFKEAQDLPEEDRNMLGPIGFDDDRLVMPLQAADLLAYELNKYHRGRFRTSGKALNEVKGAYVIWHPHKLLRWAGEAGRAIEAREAGLPYTMPEDWY